MNDNDKTLPNAATSIILFTLMFGIGHGVVRYHVAGPVPWKDFPLFILNYEYNGGPK